MYSGCCCGGGRDEIVKIVKRVERENEDLVRRWKREADRISGL
jgi:hypothetical protein